MELRENIEKAFILNQKKTEDDTLNTFAYKSKDATRLKLELPSYRTTFTRDADRILHSFSYARFFDKTQVFFWIDSDLHQHRLLHVQLVSKLARSTAELLGLNKELVEAIALGHDIGHVPLGHDGEDILDEIEKRKDEQL